MIAKIGMTGRAVLLLSATASLITAVYFVSPAEAARRDSARVMLLDHCVMEEYRRQHNSDGVVKRCQCASKKAVETLDAAQIDRMSFGRPLSRAQRKELLGAMQQCK